MSNKVPSSGTQIVDGAVVWYSSEAFHYQMTQLLHVKGTESLFVFKDLLTCVGMPVCGFGVAVCGPNNVHFFGDMLWCCAIRSHFVKYSFLVRHWE